MAKILIRILASLALVAALTLVRLSLLGALGTLSPFGMFYPGVVLAALLLGSAGAVATIIFSVISADYFLIGPVGVLFVADRPQDLLAIGVFVFNGLLICVMTIFFRRHRERVKRLEAEKRLLEESRRNAERSEVLNQRLNLAVKAGNFGIWDWDIVHDQLVWDDRMYELYGIQREDFGGAYAAWLSGVHPEDRVRSEEATRKSLTGEREYDTEFRVVWPDGSVHHLKSFGVVLRDVEGKPLRQIGVNQDISESKRADEALRESERRFRLATEESPFPVMIHAEDGEVLALSRAWSELSGYRIEEIPTVGEWTWKAYGERRQAVLDEISTHYDLKSRKATGEFTIRCSDGSTRVWDFSSISLGSLPDGRRTAMSVAFDVTERKRVELALQESEFFFKESQKAAAIGSYKTDFVSGQWKSSEVLDTIFGIDGSYEKTVPGWLNLIHPEDREMMNRYLQEEVIGRRQRFAREYRIIREGTGETRWVFGQGEASFDAQGTPLSLIGTIQDITDRKRDEQERSRLQAQLFQAQKMENLGSLAGGIAHDMNNVLAAILSLSSIKVVTLPVDDPQYDSFEKIAKAAERGGTMIKRLLGFARQGQVEEKPVDLNSLIDEALGLLERSTPAEVHIEKEFDPRLQTILGDPDALSLAIMNLCLNAFDALSEAGTLTLRTRNRGDGIEVQVQDNGFGMSQDVLAKAVDPFFTTKPVGKGTGLGLSLVYMTVQAHRGQMELQSEPQHGTLVTLRLPARVPTLPSGPLAPAPDSEIAAPLKVLLVDDDEMIRYSLRQTLETLGHQVTVVSGGEEALARLRDGLCPELVLLDINMPELDGSQTLARIRGLLPALPVVLTTGRTDQTALDLARTYPHVTLLPKPFGTEALRRSLAVARSL